MPSPNVYRDTLALTLTLEGLDTVATGYALKYGGREGNPFVRDMHGLVGWKLVTVGLFPLTVAKVSERKPGIGKWMRRGYVVFRVAVIGNNAVRAWRYHKKR